MKTRLRIFTLECYWFYQRSHNAVRTRWEQVLGRTEPAPSNQKILSTVKRFHEEGTIGDLKRSGRPVSATDEDSIKEVREFFEENERYSIRRAALEMGRKPTAVQKILRKKIKSYPYKLRILQRMDQFDFDRRDQFAFRMLGWMSRGKLDQERIWFTDEAHFWLDGYVNKQNYRIWGTENPRSFETAPLKSQKITCWCAISSKGLIGPFFFAGNVNSSAYKEMLEDEFIPAAQGLDAVDGWWFMQDGATCHRTRESFDVLDEHFHGRVLGLDYESRFGCGIEWPPYSPDLNPCDYYLWGKLKDNIYRNRIPNLERLKALLTEECLKITAEELNRVIVAFKERLEAVQGADGGHIEQFM